MIRYRIQVHGIVQGVGYRPFVYSLAARLSLTGWVYNHAAGVTVEIQGEEGVCGEFLRQISTEKPPLARVDGVEAEAVPLLCGEQGFAIHASQSGSRDTLISPDMGICPACRKEILDPADRRYRYPFTNCTNCGPRFTIIRDLPYDRPTTTMADFPMCQDCAAEYADPSARRFHAQPNACPVCGPQLSYDGPAGQATEDVALRLAQRDLLAGYIVAVKGIGGYHLVCDATQESAVLALRQRKYRWDKPFAVMVADLATARRCCQIVPAEETLLISQRAPIVLLEKRQERKAETLALAPSIAPGNGRIGVMLPYTPLHQLLIQGFSALVMTSGNVSDEPLAYEDEEAKQRLSGLADGFLSHDRAIFRRCDDSVTLWAAGGERLIRRSRGYAPEPLSLASPAPILACGGQQKNTFCLVARGLAFLSQHLGDVENAPTWDFYRGEIAHFQRMFNIRPELIAYDMHPAYLTSQYALSLPQSKKIPVQHHHAHLASVLAENEYPSTALGLIFDGTGYGPDSTLWGGEALVGDCAAYRRAARLLPLALPGGEAAIQQPWRVAMSALAACGPEWLEQAPAGLLEPGWQQLLRAVRQGVNAPLSSGMGRLFDGVAALAGLGRRVNYEGQAAVLLEQAVDDSVIGSYEIPLLSEAEGLTADWRPLIRAVVRDVQAGAGPGAVAARFHRAVANLCLELSEKLGREQGLEAVALSGGCWQNVRLLETVSQKLTARGFRVLLNQRVPANDGGLSYGQAAVAAALAQQGAI